jgi:hypothetical protein
MHNKKVVTSEQSPKAIGPYSAESRQVVLFTPLVNWAWNQLPGF